MPPEPEFLRSSTTVAPFLLQMWIFGIDPARVKKPVDLVCGLIDSFNKSNFEAALQGRRAAEGSLHNLCLAILFENHMARQAVEYFKYVAKILTFLSSVPTQRAIVRYRMSQLHRPNNKAPPKGIWLKSRTPSSSHLEPQIIIHRHGELLIGSKVALGGLDRRVP
jgi:hypothetical protein